jgi:DNA-binding HxlR family transcriptional regulator
VKRFAATVKQTEIVTKVLEAADRGSDIEFHDLRAALSYGPGVTKQALQYSIRYLEEHGFVSRKYGEKRKCFIAPTLLAYQVFRPTPSIL